MPIHLKILPQGATQRKWFSIIVTVIVSGGILILNTEAFGSYGLALFVLTPVFMGMCCTILLGYKREISIQHGWNVSFQALGVFGVALLVFAIEGVICIAMVAPIAFLLVWLGSTIGYLIVANTFASPPTMLLLILGNTNLGFY